MRIARLRPAPGVVAVDPLLRHEIHWLRLTLPRGTILIAIFAVADQGEGLLFVLTPLVRDLVGLRAHAVLGALGRRRLLRQCLDHLGSGLPCSLHLCGFLRGWALVHRTGKPKEDILGHLRVALGRFGRGDAKARRERACQGHLQLGCVAGLHAPRRFDVH
eukprot:scaffold52642_cov57-Phaeocystis_antarctica.AAC.1